MQIYEGTIKYEAGEPYDGRFGLRINVVIDMDDHNAPKTDDGELKLYKSPDSTDGRYMKTLRTGDRVRLVYTDNGRMSYYNFVTHRDQQNSDQRRNEQPARPAVQPTPNQQSQSSGSARIWLPMNDEQLVVYTHIAEQELELLAHIMTMTHQRFGDKLDAETVWKASVTIYINAGKKFNPNFIILDDQPDYEPDGGYSQDEPETGDIVF